MRSYSARVIAWIIVYLLFILGPLFALMLGSWPPTRDFWTEFSVALGYAGLAMMGRTHFFGKAWFLRRFFKVLSRLTDINQRLLFAALRTVADTLQHGAVVCQGPGFFRKQDAPILVLFDSEDQARSAPGD
jgi:hypothetical protein